MAWLVLKSCKTMDFAIPSSFHVISKYELILRKLFLNKNDEKLSFGEPQKWDPPDNEISSHAAALWHDRRGHVGLSNDAIVHSLVLFFAELCLLKHTTFLMSHRCLTNYQSVVGFSRPKRGFMRHWYFLLLFRRFISIDLGYLVSIYECRPKNALNIIRS